MATMAVTNTTTFKPLAVLTEIRDALAEVANVDEALHLINKAEALRVCCRKAGLSQEVCNMAAEMKLRAERQAGELLAEQVSHGGDRKSKSHDGTLKLEEIGINKNQSSRWQRIASIDEEEFEQELSTFHECGREITTATRWS